MEYNTMTTKTTTVQLQRYPKIEQSYFLDIDGTRTEVFKLGASTTAKEGATIYTVLTSTQKTHEFVTEAHAIKVDPEVARERKKQENELFKLYRSHEIGLEQFTSAMAQLAS